jgi:RNA polymerase sigma factor (TIGR02999 family)
VDFARSQQYLKHSGNSPTVSLSLDEAPAVAPEKTADLLAVHEALEELSKTDPRKEKVVELRFFGGLSVEETAEVLHVSPDTVQRDWRLAKIWLLKELSGRASHGR